MSQNAVRRGVRESLSGEVKPKSKLKEGLPKQREQKENQPTKWSRKTCAKAFPLHTHGGTCARTSGGRVSVIEGKLKRLRRIRHNSLLHSEIHEELLKDMELGIEVTRFTHHQGHSGCRAANQIGERKD